MHQVRGVVHGPSWGLSVPRKGVRFARDRPWLALLRSSYSPIHRSQEGTQTERGIGLRESAQTVIGGELGGVEVGVERGGGQGKGHRLGHEASPRKAWSITSA